MSNLLSPETLQIPSLGRPFSLGALYNCRTEQIIPGVTLWDQEDLRNHVEKRSEERVQMQIITEDNIEQKTDALGIEGGLKLSVMCNLINLSGSASYINDRASSKCQQRITMKYTCTTTFEHLTMTHLALGNVKHAEVFEHGTATHVVTGILYGANTFLVFDAEKSEQTGNLQSKASLVGALEKIPKAAVDVGSGSVEANVSATESNTIKNFRCTFHGDFQPTTNPTTYSDAIHLYQEIPRSLKQDGGKAVPLIVYLYPLSKLDSKASSIFKEISKDVVHQVEKCFDRLHDLDARCNDLLKEEVCQIFRKLYDCIAEFKDRIKRYKLILQKRMMELLPGVRSGAREEKLIINILNDDENSPFCYRVLNRRLDELEQYVTIVREQMKAMGPRIQQCRNEGQLKARILDPQSEVCFGYIFQMSDRDKLASCQNQFLEECNNGKYSMETGKTADFASKDEVDGQIKLNCKAFAQWSKWNEANPKVSFAVAFQSCDDVGVGLTGSVRLYKDGRLVCDDVKFPNVTRPRLRDAYDDALVVTWDDVLPDINMETYIERYEVWHRSVYSDVWIIGTSETNLFRAEHLDVGAPYVFKVRAFYASLGACETDMSEPFTTLPTSPPEQPKVRRLGRQHKILVEWQVPTRLSKELVDACIGYELQQCDGNGDDLGMGWMSVTTIDSNQSNLRYIYNAKAGGSTKFRVRTLCDGTFSRFSPESETISIGDTSKMKALLKVQLLNEMCTKIDDGRAKSIYRLENVNKVFENDIDKIRHFSIGEKEPGDPNKVMLVVGATGDGKTTLINAMFNHIVGVRFEDEYRFRIVDEETKDRAESQTDWVTAFTIHGGSEQYRNVSITLIDTPGFGDTRGVSRDEEIVIQVERFLASRGSSGFDHIAAVGIVVKGSHTRLTDTLRYIFERVLSLFGKNIEKNLFILFTFVDFASEEIQALDPIKSAGIPFKSYFKFNNSVLFSDAVSNPFASAIWGMTQQNYDKLLQVVNNVDETSLMQTREVLRKRATRKKSVGLLHKELTSAIKYLSSMRDECSRLKSELGQKTEKPLEEGKWALNCDKCGMSCDATCKARTRYTCSVFSFFGYCRVCPERCHYTWHNFYKYQIVSGEPEEAVRHKIKEIQEKGQRFAAVQLRVIEIIQKIQRVSYDLEVMALRHKPSMIVDYIDHQIKMEESKPDCDYRRVEALQDVRSIMRLMLDRKDENLITKLEDVNWDTIDGLRTTGDIEADVNRIPENILEKSEELIKHMKGTLEGDQKGESTDQESTVETDGEPVKATQ